MISIKTIWEKQKPTDDIIVKTRIEDIKYLNCYAGSNQITGEHLFIISFSKDVTLPELKNYRFKGVEIFKVEVDLHIELNIYLIENELKDIFSLFVQNILEDIEHCLDESEAITITLNTVSKWKKLFDAVNFNGLSIEQQKGLIGELLFLKFLLNNDKTSMIAINSWTSAEPDLKSKDFALGTVGVEIKFTSAIQPRIKVSNERQLDAENLSELFLVLYSAEAVKDGGISLNSIIEQVRNAILTNEERSIFNNQLQLIGYFDEDKLYYNKMYSLKSTYCFSITGEFPKIVKGNLPQGIYDTSYSIELSAVEKYLVEFERLLLNF
jgi:hypothetical protein